MRTYVHHIRIAGNASSLYYYVHVERAAEKITEGGGGRRRRMTQKTNERSDLNRETKQNKTTLTLVNERRPAGQYEAKGGAYK